jgi:hypothetical protein
MKAIISASSETGGITEDVGKKEGQRKGTKAKRK